MIPPEFVHELLARTDVVEVVGRHVELKKSGAHHKGLCPFHAEKSPSFMVSPSRQTYKCFGCGQGGNAVGFLIEHLGLSFPEAVRDLAEQVGLQVPDDDRQAPDPQLRERQADLTELLSRAAAHYRERLKASAPAVDYLKRRGVSGAVAARFGLGYAPDAWRGLASVFPAYDDPRLEEAGLVLASGEEASNPASRKRYDRFRDRIMFPIRSVQGAIVGFGGRVLDGGGEPKYLNSPETPVFTKGRELYGLYEARTAIREAGHALVVEGYMDVVALAQLGLPQAVATLGTACTPDHVHKLFRHTDTVVFAFDGDAAGQRAAARALEAALPHANDLRTVRFLTLPPEHDPDSYVRAHGAEAFRRCIDAATPLSLMLLEVAKRGCDPALAEGRARFAAQARPLWSLLPEGAFKRQLLGDLAVQAGLGSEELGRMWSAASAPARLPSPRAGASSLHQPHQPHLPQAVTHVNARRLRVDAASLPERALWLLWHRMDVWESLDARSQRLLTEQPPPHGPLFLAIERCLTDHGALDPSALRAELSAPGRADDAASQTVIGRIAAFHPPESGGDALAALQILVDRLRLQAVQDELGQLFESGVESPDADARSSALLRAQAELKGRLARVSAGSPAQHL